MKFFITLCVIFLLEFGSSSVIWQRYGLDKCSTLQCDSIYQQNRSYLCTADSGVYYSHSSLQAEEKPCITATMTSGRIFHPHEIINKVGFGGVLAFVGDSIVRSLFVTTMEFLGPEYSAWYHEIVNMSATWEGAPREKIDHTYLSSPLLGPNKITIAFFWRVQLGAGLMNKLPFNRGWQNCVWWENGNAMRHCDGSRADGAKERWQGNDLLDSVQLPGKAKREFIVIASGGVHSTHKCKNIVEEEAYINDNADFRMFMDPWIKTKNQWSISDEAHGSGRSIFFFAIVNQRVLLPRRLSLCIC